MQYQRLAEPPQIPLVDNVYPDIVYAPVQDTYYDVFERVYFDAPVVEVPFVENCYPEEIQYTQELQLDSVFGVTYVEPAPTPTVEYSFFMFTWG